MGHLWAAQALKRIHSLRLFITMKGDRSCFFVAK
jgi:hypothetical protein